MYLADSPAETFCPPYDVRLSTPKPGTLFHARGVCCLSMHPAELTHDHRRDPVDARARRAALLEGHSHSGQPR
jgi:hypothetical protein